MKLLHRQRGFTLIELIIVLVVMAVLLVVAVGGFGSSFARKRVEGRAADIVTHLQQARTEAISRNGPVRTTLGTNCLLVHTWPALATAPSCSGSTVTSSLPVVILAAVEFTASDVTVTREPVGQPVGYYQFNPFNNASGWLETDGGNNHGLVVGSSAGSWQLRLRVGLTGRVEICTPTSNSLPGYAAC